jgi:hypothetical protein
MKTSVCRAVALAAIFVCVASAQEKRTTIESLRWLTGCWEMNSRGRVVSENWMKPAGKTMMGTSRTVMEGKTLEYEFVRLVQEGDGSINYIAKPSDQEEASFKLVSLEGKKVVFENLQHDFPQRVIYFLHTADSLIARIEGTLNGNERGRDFPYRRVKCE